jgi:F-type H+-transporting ATPase subunit a
MSADHYTYISEYISSHHLQKATTAVGVALGMCLVGLITTRKLRSPESLEKSVAPSSSVSISGVVDFSIESFVKFHDSVVGKENRRYVSFTAFLFFFIFISNLVGLIPGMAAATNSVGITVGLALASFVYFNAQGIREHGFIPYILHFAGPVWWLAWLIFPLEIFSTLLRILTLNLRLYWNIHADHMVLGILTELLGFATVPAYIIGTFVSFMQAFVFTVLSMVYILLATQHGDESHGEDH